MNSKKRKYKMSLMICSLALLAILAFMPINTAHTVGFELKDLPSGGHTIIIGDTAYSKEYLGKNKAILTTALSENKTVYVKLAEGIFIDQRGQLVSLSDISKMPQITKYIIEDIVETEFKVMDIY